MAEFVCVNLEKEQKKREQEVLGKRLDVIDRSHDILEKGNEQLRQSLSAENYGCAEMEYEKERLDSAATEESDEFSQNANGKLGGELVVAVVEADFAEQHQNASEQMIEELGEEGEQQPRDELAFAGGIGCHTQNENDQLLLDSSAARESIQKAIENHGEKLVVANEIEGGANTDMEAQRSKEDRKRRPKKLSFTDDCSQENGRPPFKKTRVVAEEPGKTASKTAMKRRSCCESVHPEDTKWCSLFDAIDKCDFGSVRAFLRLGAEASGLHAHRLGYTPLQVACLLGYGQIVAVLLLAGAHTGKAEGDTTTALHNACMGRHLSVVELLLQHGVPADELDSGGATALHRAVTKGVTDIVQALLDYGFNPNLRKGPHDSAAIHLAARRLDQGAVMRVLLKDGVHDINADDSDGNTALHLAAMAGCAESVRLLLQSGADFTLQNTLGKTALAVARDPVVVQILRARQRRHKADKACH